MARQLRTNEALFTNVYHFLTFIENDKSDGARESEKQNDESCESYQATLESQERLQEVPSCLERVENIEGLYHNTKFLEKILNQHNFEIE